MTRRHGAAAVATVTIGLLAPVGVTASTAPATSGPATTAPSITEPAPPPVIDELVDPVDRKPDGPGSWVGAAALVGGLGAVVAAVAFARRRQGPR